MAVTVLIPTALQQYSGNQETLTVQGKTVKEALSSLMSKYPDLKKHLFNEKNELRSFVNVYLNDEDIRYQKDQQTPVKDGDTVTIVPSIAGGLDSGADRSAAGAVPDSNRVRGGVNLSQEELKRYSRHLIMPEVGIEGQKKIKSAKVLCVGSGGLGSPMALYLAAAGVGTLGLVDFDVVDFSNLQRQILFGTSDVGKPKVKTAQAKLEDINPNIKIVPHEAKLTSENAMQIVAQYDIVADGTDNFPTRYLVNDACVLLGKPNVYGSIFRFEGQASVFDAKRGPCYRCLYPEPPPPGLVPSCAEGGVLGILPGIIGTIQATETVKLILGKGNPLIGRLLLFNALKMSFREMKLRKNTDCPICGTKKTITKLIDYEQFCGLRIGQESAGEAALKPNRFEDSSVLEPIGLKGEAAAKADSVEITAEELKKKLDRKETVLIDVREPFEYDICHIEGAKLIPLGDLPNRVGELNPDDHIVLHCHHGGRSMRALQFLQSAGFKKVKNLTGGIDVWAEKIEPSMARY